MVWPAALTVKSCEAYVADEVHDVGGYSVSTKSNLKRLRVNSLYERPVSSQGEGRKENFRCALLFQEVS